MRVSLVREGIVFTAETEPDVHTLRRRFKHEHLHFSCKAIGKNKFGLTELLLTPSVISWQRPKKGLGSR